MRSCWFSRRLLISESANAVPVTRVPPALKARAAARASFLTLTISPTPAVVSLVRPGRSAAGGDILSSTRAALPSEKEAISRKRFVIPPHAKKLAMLRNSLANTYPAGQVGKDGREPTPARPPLSPRPAGPGSGSRSTARLKVPTPSGGLRGAWLRVSASPRPERGGRHCRH